MDKFYDKIEDYLNGELDAQALEAFEVALAQDAQLRAAVGQTRAVIEQLHAMRFRQVVKKNIQPRPAQGVFPMANRRMLAIAATLLLVAAATYFWRESSVREAGMAAENAKQPKPNEQPVALEPSKRDTDRSRPEVVPMPEAPSKPARENMGADLKTRLAYNDAISRLEKIDYTLMGEAKKDAALEQKLNQAIALLQTKKTAEAIALLEPVDTSNNPLYKEDAEWLLSVAWLLQNPTKGKARLSTIAQAPAHTYRADALRLLRTLE